MNQSFWIGFEKRAGFIRNWKPTDRYSETSDWHGKDYRHTVSASKHKTPGQAIKILRKSYDENRHPSYAFGAHLFGYIPSKDAEIHAHLKDLWGNPNEGIFEIHEMTKPGGG